MSADLKFILLQTITEGRSHHSWKLQAYFDTVWSSVSFARERLPGANCGADQLAQLQRH